MAKLSLNLIFYFSKINIFFMQIFFILIFKTIKFNNYIIFIAKKRDIFNKIIIKKLDNFFWNFYYITFDIRKLKAILHKYRKI